MEEWRPVLGFEGLYEVSNTGKVRSASYTHIRYRIHGETRKLDIYEAQHRSKLLKPCRINKKTGAVIYHLHKRVKHGYYGQTDVYPSVETLVWEAFPELYEKEN